MSEKPTKALAAKQSAKQSAKKTGQQEEPLIRFGEHWIPAHQAWKKMETASAVADVIEHFNTNFPHLSSQQTRAVVPDVRQRLKDIQLRMPRKAETPDFSTIASDLLGMMPPEDAIDELARDHGMDIDLHELIAIVGQQAYLGALQREAIEYQQNQILEEQTSHIWNEMARPAPGGGLWNKQKIEKLIQNGTLG